MPAALHTGADAVYLGAEKFSARKNAANFTRKELSEAVAECHRHGVKVYLAMNTIIRDDELEDSAELLRFACEIGIDGLIIQDFAVYEQAKQCCPKMPLHASTQMTVHTPFGVMAARRLGFSRVVAARELSLSELASLCGLGVEIEAFSHGALCMCVSGQCYLSAMIGGRSANRGLCAGACRLPFSAAGKPENDYALSLKDMSYCGRISELEKIGISSLKIEGRMKRPEYVAAATNALFCARAGKDYDAESLHAVFSRSGFTDGYLDGDPGAEIFGARLKEDVEAASKALPKLKKLYEKTEKRFTLNLRFKAERGKPIELFADDGSLSATVFGEPPEEALNAPTSTEDVSEQLKKLGGTLYDAGRVEVDIEDGLILPKSAINALRREAVSKLDSMRAAAKPIPFDGSGLVFDFPHLLIRKVPRLRVHAESVGQLSLLDKNDLEAMIPLGSEKEFLDAGFSPEKASVWLPRFMPNEKKAAEMLSFAKSLGFSGVECHNIGQTELVKSLGMKPEGGFGLNISNSLAARHYYADGVERLTLSPELKAAQCSQTACPGDLGAIIYGRLPLMITRCCPIAAQVGCAACKKRLIDRTGAVFPVLCRREKGYFEILNSKVLRLEDRLGQFSLDFGIIYLTDETPEQAFEVFNDYRRGRLSQAVGFTRGLYFRGVE